MMVSDPPDFVNRDAEIGAFTGLLAQPRQRILLVHGVPRIGKTYLVQRLHAYCRKQDVVSALVDFRSDRMLTRADRVVRRLRDQIGGIFAEQLGRAEAQILHDLGYTAATGQNTLTETDLTRLGLTGQGGGGVRLSGEVRVGGDLVGRDKIIIKNSSIILNPASGPALVEMEAESRRNAALRAALAALQAERRVVLFFDHFENATEDVASWLRRQLLSLQLEDAGACPNLWLVVAGCQAPLQDERDLWYHVMCDQDIGPLAEDAISLFWVGKRRLDPASLPVITRASGGNPWLLSVMANNFGASMQVGR